MAKRWLGSNIRVRESWAANTAFLPLHQMNWWQLRETVVYDPARRRAAWDAMTARSVRARGCVEEIARFWRDHE